MRPRHLHSSHVFARARRKVRAAERKIRVKVDSTTLTIDPVVASRPFRLAPTTVRVFFTREQEIQFDQIPSLSPGSGESPKPPRRNHGGHERNR